jgi:hypothetical protein
MQPPAQFGELTIPIAEGATETDEVLLDEEQTSDVLGGTEWHLSALPDGSLHGGVHFNLDEFERSTAESWTTGLKRILASATGKPDLDWRQL